MADVLVYQRAGGAIRGHVRSVLAAVTDAQRPLVAMGNSLGGIILVDLLREPDAPRPDLLVTAGSQAPVLQTFGGLGEDASRPPFQPWLNFYDQRDFLAFIAEPVWPGEPGSTTSEWTWTSGSLTSTAPRISRIRLCSRPSSAARRCAATRRVPDRSAYRGTHSIPARDTLPLPPWGVGLRERRPCRPNGEVPRRRDRAPYAATHTPGASFPGLRGA